MEASFLVLHEVSNTLYLKLRIFPTEEIVAKWNKKRGEVEELILVDTFYDTRCYDNGGKNKYIRKRTNRGGLTKIVEQDCSTTKDGILIYTENNLGDLPVVCTEEFLSYEFKRRIKKDTSSSQGGTETSYFDEIDISEDDKYRMLTISREVKSNNPRQILITLQKTLSEWDLDLSCDQQEEELEKQKEKLEKEKADLGLNEEEFELWKELKLLEEESKIEKEEEEYMLENEKLCQSQKDLLEIYECITNNPKYLPMPTKFMTMLRISENSHKYYDLYFRNDPFYTANYLKHLRQLVKDGKQAIAAQYYWSVSTREILFYGEFYSAQNSQKKLGNCTASDPKKLREAREQAMRKVQEQYDYQKNAASEFLFDDLLIY